MQTFAMEVAKAREDLALAAETIVNLNAAVAKLTEEKAQAEESIKAQTARQTAALDEQAAVLAAARAELVKVQDLLAAEKARGDALEAKLALVPAMADVSGGQPPVADGGAAGGEVTDWIKAVESRTGADRQAFYSANAAQIDAAYRAAARRK